jgi:hypothetical protein
MTVRAMPAMNNPINSTNGSARLIWDKCPPIQPKGGGEQDHQREEQPHDARPLTRVHDEYYQLVEQGADER